jgi:phenylacetate-CoA ligase
LSHLLKDLPGLHTFRAVQESLDLIRLLVVTERPLDERAVARIRSGLAEQLGETTELLVEQVADIPLDPTGKHRHIVCRVPASVA